MPRTIEEVLSYRSDLSTFLVHLTRDQGDRDAKACLIQIIDDWQLNAGNTQGPAARRLRNAHLPDDDQRVVCFTETPLEHVKLLTEEITGRDICLSSYGVAITKKQGRRAGVNPVWYLDQTAGQEARWRNQDVEALIDVAIANRNIPGLDRVFHLTPFIEQMGTWPTGRKEFWWEREWRFVGDLALPARLIVLCPEEDFPDLAAAAGVAERACVFIDPRWSLERMIAHLAGFNPQDATNP